MPKSERICAQALEEDTLVSSRLLSHVDRWNPHYFSKSDLVGAPLLGPDALGLGAQSKDGTPRFS